MSYFLQGLLFGLAYVAPIGVQNMFVINTGLTQPRNKAYITALIVIFFDISLAMACFFGIGALMNKFEIIRLAISLIGGIVIIIMGVKLIMSKDSVSTDTDVDIPVIKVISMACVVTWFNPQALIDGSLLLGAFHASLPAGMDYAFILGVACASCTWFLGITTVTSVFRGHFNEKILRLINIVCGAIILIYGAKLMISFFSML